MNRVILIGRLGSEVELKVVGQSSVANFSLATSEKFKNQAGEAVEKTEWHNISVWGKMAEIASKFIKKGSLVCIEGKIETKKYTGSDGIERYKTQILCSNLEMLGDKKPTEDKPEQNQQNPTYQTDDISHREGGDDDLPF